MGAGASAAQTQNRLPDGKASFEIQIVGDEQTFVTELKEAACKQSLQLGLLAPFIERIVHEKRKKIACCAVQVNGKLQNSHEIRQPLISFVVPGETTTILVTLELVSAIEARRAKKAAAAEAKQDASAGPTCSMGSSSSSRGSSSSSYGTVTYGVARPNPRVVAKPGDDPFHNPLIMILDDVLTDNNRQ